MKKPDIILRLLRIPLDFVAVLGAFLLIYWLRADVEWMAYWGLENPLLLPWRNYLWFSLQASALVVVIFAMERMYSLRKTYRFRKEFRRMVMLLGAAFTIIILYFFITGIHFFSRFVLGGAFLLSIAFMTFHRLLLKLVQIWMWKKGIGKRKVLFVGEGTALQELAQIWKQRKVFDLVGCLSDRASADAGIRRLGTLDDLESVIKRYDIDEVVQGGKSKNSAEVVEFCQLNHIEYRFIPDLLDVQRTNTEVDFVRDIPVITLRSSAIDGWARVVKRVVDIIGSTIGLILFSPLFLLVAIAIQFDDPGPVFYKSRRVSKDKQFWMWKFRSMVVDADKRKKELMEQNRRSGPLFKIEKDPRITAFGRFLRKTSLDELPQLWNVLKGDLSLVGPRAHLPEEIAQYEKHHRKVLAVKAGVTGLPQVSGRSRLDFEKEVKLDLYYLENWSLWLDIKILFKTFTVLFDGE